MSWRIVKISNPCKLKIKHSQLVFITEDQEEVTLPLEDISVLIFESPQVQLNSYLISKLGEYNIALFGCDEKHLPNGVYIPFSQHSRHTKVAFTQINMTEPFKKRLWQKIIKQKIYNQSYLAYKLKTDDELFYLIEKVQSGDTTNVEAFCSKMYWHKLFDDFKRKNNDKRNSLMNYGYAIIRGILSRDIASSGLITCFGVHHKSELNPFNLADDLIEPFRPFVDELVYKMTKNKNYNDDNIEPEEKIELLELFEKHCLFKDEKTNLLNACEATVKSFVSSMKEKNPDILNLPSFIERN